MTQKYAKDQPAGFTNRISRVAIVGATGNVGSHFTRSLLATKSHELTALTRSASTALPAGVRAAVVDYSDESTLISALSGQDFLIITLSPRAPPSTHATLLSAAKRAGVKYVMPNCYGTILPGSEHAEWKKGSLYMDGIDARLRDVEEAGLRWVALSCGFWFEMGLGTEMAVEAYGVDVKGRKAILFDEGNGRVRASSLRRCGEAVAVVLSLPELPEDEGDEKPTLASWVGKPLHVHSYHFTQREILSVLHRQLDTTDADWDISSVPSQERYASGIKAMQEGNMGGFFRAMVVRDFFPDAIGVAEQLVREGEENARLLGLGEEKLEEGVGLAVEISRRGWKEVMGGNGA